MGLEICSALRETVAHDRLLHEGFAERLALQTVFERRGNGNARDAVHGDGDGEAFVVEVLHDVFHAMAFDADEVGHGHLDVVELDESCPGGGLAANFDTAHRYTFGVEKGHNEHAET